MSAQFSLYQTMLQRICALTAHSAVPLYSVKRLALLVSGILAARSTVLAQLADEINDLGLTAATTTESVARRLRRTLNDPNLLPTTCYDPLLAQLLDWDGLLTSTRRVVIAIDESSKAAQIHLLRAALCYWGGSLPLAWVCWAQNEPQAEGHYWQQLDKLFAQLAPLLPAGIEVVIVADRAYAVSNFIDRCTQRGWHYVVRITSNGSHRYAELGAEEQSLREVVARRVSKPGERWSGEGELFKKAGWRKVRLVGIWRLGNEEPLVVVSDLRQDWQTLRYYERRFWIESGFRNDKSKGWQWEQSQVQSVAHHERLLLAMAWASLVVLCLGLAAAQQQLAQERTRRNAGKVAKPRGARQSLFTQGLRVVRRWLYGTSKAQVRWHLADLGAPSWQEQWLQAQVVPLAKQLPQAA